MRKKLAGAAIVALLSAPMALPAPAFAQPYDGYHHNNDYRSDNYHQDRTYNGRNGRYRYRCKRSSGTTGAVVGGVGGALAGNALGGGTLGTLAGAGGGLLLGRHLDKKHDAAQNRRNGC